MSDDCAAKKEAPTVTYNAIQFSTVQLEFDGIPISGGTASQIG